MRIRIQFNILMRIRIKKNKKIAYLIFFPIPGPDPGAPRSKRHGIPDPDSPNCLRSWSAWQIRLHHFRPNTDPDPIRIQGFKYQKLRNYRKNNFFKNYHLPIPKPPYKFISSFVGHFCPAGSGSTTLSLISQKYRFSIRDQRSGNKLFRIQGSKRHRWFGLENFELCRNKISKITNDSYNLS